MSNQYNFNPGCQQQPEGWLSMQSAGQQQQYQNQGQQPSFLQASSSYYAVTSNQQSQQSQAYGQQAPLYEQQSVASSPTWLPQQPHSAGSASSASWTVPQSSYAPLPQTQTVPQIGTLSWPAIGFGLNPGSGTQPGNIQTPYGARLMTAPLTGPPPSDSGTTSTPLHQTQIQPPTGWMRAQDTSAQDRQRYQTQNTRLLKAGLITCPAGYAWFDLVYKRGWICGCGLHAFDGKDLRVIERTRDTADIAPVNQTMPSTSAKLRRQGRCEWLLAVHPPNVAPELPMHRVHSQYMEQVKQGGHYADKGSKGLAGDLPETKKRPCVCVRDLNIPVTNRRIAPRPVSCSEFGSEGPVAIVDKDEDGEDEYLR